MDSANSTQDTASETLYWLGLTNLETSQEIKPETPSFSIANGGALKQLLSHAYASINPTASSELWLLAYLDYAVVWGKYSEKGLETRETLDPEFLQELRLFGPNGEYYLWRSDETGFQARLRVDEATSIEFRENTGKWKEAKGYTPLPVASDLPHIAEEWQVLWGTSVKVEADTSWTTLTEERGVNMAFPATLIENQLPLRLRVRHYLDYDEETGLCYYKDLRLVEVCAKNLEPLI